MTGCEWGGVGWAAVAIEQVNGPANASTPQTIAPPSLHRTSSLLYAYPAPATPTPRPTPCPIPVSSLRAPPHHSHLLPFLSGPPIQLQTPPPPRRPHHCLPPPPAPHTYMSCLHPTTRSSISSLHLCFMTHRAESKGLMGGLLGIRSCIAYGTYPHITSPSKRKAPHPQPQPLSASNLRPRVIQA